MKNNWFEEESNIPIIMFAYCKNSTANNNWCKEHDEVDEWLKVRPQYFAYQKTVVQQDIFQENKEVVDNHPYYGDESKYFPTIKLMTSYKFGPIEVDKDKKVN